MLKFIKQKCRQKCRQKKRQKKAIFFTALVSTTLGTLCTFFLSPKNGKENREQLKRVAKDASKKLQKTHQEKIKPKIFKLKDRIKAKLEKSKQIKEVEDESEEY